MQLKPLTKGTGFQSGLAERHGPFGATSAIPIVSYYLDVIRDSNDDGQLVSDFRRMPNKILNLDAGSSFPRPGKQPTMTRSRSKKPPYSANTPHSAAKRWIRFFRLSSISLPFQDGVAPGTTLTAAVTILSTGHGFVAVSDLPQRLDRQRDRRQPHRRRTLKIPQAGNR